MARKPRQSRRGEKVGNERKRHPLPLRLRNPFIPQEFGGSEGWRGPSWRTIRQKALQRDRFRSTISGFTASQGNGLQVDHINPFRLGGKNTLSNLRTTDFYNNPATDFMRGAGERPPERDKRY